MREIISLDSNCYTYLLQAFRSGEEPSGETANEQISVLKLYLYLDSIFALASAVVDEYSQIRNKEWRGFHQSTGMALIDRFHNIDMAQVLMRAQELAQHHSGENDCHILAESELGGANYLLTYDSDFISRLGPATKNMAILRPSELLRDKNIGQGALPKKVPHSTNPLCEKKFWRI